MLEATNRPRSIQRRNRAPRRFPSQHPFSGGIEHDPYIRFVPVDRSSVDFPIIALSHSEAPLMPLRATIGDSSGGGDFALAALYVVSPPAQDLFFYANRLFVAAAFRIAPGFHSARFLSVTNPGGRRHPPDRSACRPCAGRAIAPRHRRAKSRRRAWRCGCTGSSGNRPAAASRHASGYGPW